MNEKTDRPKFEDAIEAADAAEKLGDWAVASDFLADCLAVATTDEAAFRYVIALWNAERFELCERETEKFAQAFPAHEGLTEHVKRIAEFMKYHHVAKCVDAYENDSFTEALRHGTRAAQLWPDHPWINNYITMSVLKAPGFSNLLSPDKRRIFIAGCGRSGTYLLSAMMQCFSDTYVHSGEAPVEAFQSLDAPQSTHIIKRVSDSYKTLHLVPDDIGLIHMVRHPFDVLVSEHMGTERYIKPNNWNAEIDAMRQLKHGNHIVVRYEDLVRAPNRVQGKLAEMFSLVSSSHFSDFHSHAKVPSDIEASMHGLRAPSEASVEKWRTNRHDRGYLRAIWPEIESNYRWLCRFHGYQPIESEQGF
jgi:hypothetical protein